MLFDEESKVYIENVSSADLAFLFTPTLARKFISCLATVSSLLKDMPST